jgi:hypothetical protein
MNIKITDKNKGKNNMQKLISTTVLPLNRKSLNNNFYPLDCIKDIEMFNKKPVIFEYYNKATQEVDCKDIVGFTEDAHIENDSVIATISFIESVDLPANLKKFVFRPAIWASGIEEDGVTIKEIEGISYIAMIRKEDDAFK